jgi:hypothetical protein
MLGPAAGKANADLLVVNDSGSSSKARVTLCRPEVDTEGGAKDVKANGSVIATQPYYVIARKTVAANTETTLTTEDAIIAGWTVERVSAASVGSLRALLTVQLCLSHGSRPTWVVSGLAITLAPGTHGLLQDTWHLDGTSYGPAFVRGPAQATTTEDAIVTLYGRAFGTPGAHEQEQTGHTGES